ncbi:MAG TPA: VacB/RNase II family 3'-5' exoribonuclease [Clostridiaceae bacterium]|nr:VacB/RNase II family 3'-5' exoribonuclease [Clostridiaceae bacterium]
MNALVGVLRQNGQHGIVELDRRDNELGMRISIPRKFLNGAPFNMKVVCDYKGTDSSGEPWGSIVEVLGEEGNSDAAILGIIKHYNLPLEFPAGVIEQAESFGASISEEEITEEINRGRIDLRDFKTITIDGEDAKDLDDAIDIKRLENGNYLLYVHIADVTHYVTDKSALDQEALKRGNSVYLVDRVIPMYPPQLSNGICSLNPDQDRFALTAEMEINHRGIIVKGKLYPSVICSKVRTSYNETQAILNGEDVGEDRPDWLRSQLLLMQELTDILQAMRRKRGALEFEFPEMKVELDNDGNPTDIYPEPDLYTNHMIESFMIAANEYVGDLAQKHKIPIIYRVHELPDPEKLSVFTALARRFNIRIQIDYEKPEPQELAKALEIMKDEPYGPTLSTMLLRSLAKARYCEKNLGHFGLASKNYCHFTAPIRRYSDTFTHRSLKRWLNGQIKTGKKPLKHANLIGDHVSDTERIAIDAERDTVNQKAAEYYADKIGEIYDGKISGFSPASLFVQLESLVEGAVFFRSLDGYYEYDIDQFIAINRDTGDILSLGQKVKVQIASVDTNRRFIDFHLLEHATAVANNDDKARNIRKKRDYKLNTKREMTTKAYRKVNNKNFSKDEFNPYSRRKRSITKKMRKGRRR